MISSGLDDYKQASSIGFIKTNAILAININIIVTVRPSGFERL